MGLPFQLLYSYTGAVVVFGPVILTALAGPVFGGDRAREDRVAWNEPTGMQAPGGLARRGRRPGADAAAQLGLAGVVLASVTLLGARLSPAGLFGGGPHIPTVVAVDAALLAYGAALVAIAWALRRAPRAPRRAEVLR